MVNLQKGMDMASAAAPYSLERRGECVKSCEPRRPRAKEISQHADLHAGHAELMDDHRSEAIVGAAGTIASFNVG